MSPQIDLFLSNALIIGTESLADLRTVCRLAMPMLAPLHKVNPDDPQITAAMTLAEKLLDLIPESVTCEQR